MTGIQLRNILGIEANSARYGKTGDWYHPLTSFPGILFDKNGYVIFPTQLDYENCIQIRFGQDIHISNGISSIPTYTTYTQRERIIISRLNNDHEGDLRIQREYSTYIRDYQKVLTVKQHFDNKCAICQNTIQIDDNKFYSEAHHIKPLHEDGPDELDNMICVCPTCHVKLDLKLIRIDLLDIFNPHNHIINDEYIEYHNSFL